MLLCPVGFYCLMYLFKHKSIKKAIAFFDKMSKNGLKIIFDEGELLMV
jgi:pentatricopeptide repeat protein